MHHTPDEVYEGMETERQRETKRTAANFDKAKQVLVPPFLMLAGIAPRGVKRSRLISSGDDWWGALVDRLKGGRWAGFLDFLITFPLMSITKKTVLQVMPVMSAKEFDTAVVFQTSRLLAHFVDWCKLVLKIVILHNKWTFSSPESMRREQGGALRDVSDIKAANPYSVLTGDSDRKLPRLEQQGKDKGLITDRDGVHNVTKGKMALQVVPSTFNHSQRAVSKAATRKTQLPIVPIQLPNSGFRNKASISQSPASTQLPRRHGALYHPAVSPPRHRPRDRKYIEGIQPPPVQYNSTNKDPQHAPTNQRPGSAVSGGGRSSATYSTIGSPTPTGDLNDSTIGIATIARQGHKLVTPPPQHPHNAYNTPTSVRPASAGTYQRQYSAPPKTVPPIQHHATPPAAPPPKSVSPKTWSAPSKQNGHVAAYQPPYPAAPSPPSTPPSTSARARPTTAPSSRTVFKSNNVSNPNDDHIKKLTDEMDSIRNERSLIAHSIANERNTPSSTFSPQYQPPSYDSPSYGAAAGYQSASTSSMDYGYGPPKALPYQNTPGQTEVAMWLAQNNLLEWATALTAEGYDDLDDLRDLVNHDRDQFARLVEKAGHRNKIARLLAVA
eukprot:TRINITY_DN60419_c0_g1_i1.p1 TRINITY_DN60419_c0_g1~~TRINITY_DN60419_c0_g1_i1.p1  ORF type:complete len:619 (+),score=65.06 TRINITY_DN60419_c0_g1_i1:30-1859(+)